MTNPPSSTCAPKDPFGIFFLGLKVLASETVWLVKSLPDRLERRQLDARLREERKRVDRISADAKTTAAELDLARRQVAFLDEEIRLLAVDHQEKRARFTAHRAAKWGLGSAS